ncbi:MAG: hypothetical protein QMD92_05140 [bacterium]|nr:hypothetical protein [bacterium]
MENERMDNAYLLMSKTGCTQEQAELVLESTEGNVEQAISIITVVSNKNVFIAKGRFACKTEKLFGLFLIQANNTTKELEKLEVIVTRNALLCQCDVDSNWDKFERVINSVSVRKSELSNRNMSKLHHGIIDLFNSEEKANIFILLGSNDVDKLKGILSVKIGKTLDDPNIEMVLSIDQMTGSEKPFTGGKGLSEIDGLGKKDIGKQGIDTSASKIILQTALVLSPVSGVLVSELKSGDRVAAKIIDTTGIGQYLAELMGANRKDQIIPIIAYIESIIPTEMDKVRVMLKYGHGVYGETLISKSAKIKISVERPLVKKKDMLSRINIPAIKEKIPSLPLRPIDVAILLIMILLLFMLMAKL